MRTMTTKNKILSAIAVVLGAVIFGFIVYTGIALGIAFAPEKVIEDDTEYEFTFEGNITLNEVSYDVNVKGIDGKFTLNANKISGITDGVYTFTEQQGWTFTFNDDNATVVRSQFDTESKTFGFIYHLDMGSRGEGNLKLTYEDKDFVRASVSWGDIPSFSGTALWFGGALSAQTILGCDAENNFTIFCTGGEIVEIDGKYEFVDGTYVFTTSEGTVYTAEKDENGLYGLTVPVYRPQLAVYGAADSIVTLTQVVLTVE